MKILLIDTSTTYLYVNFYDTDKKETIFSKSMVTHNNHSENLIPTIESGLNETKLELKDFDLVISGYGPGSYTGLRVGCVVSKMIAFTLEKELNKISSLLFVSTGYFKNDGIYAVSSVAKKSYKYLAIVEVKNNKINYLLNDSFVSDSEYEEILSKYENIKVINEDNYLIDSEVIINLSSKVNDIHNFVPNYLREANS